MANRGYRVVVEGELGARYAAAFEGMDLLAAAGTTEITGARDRAALSGLLRRVDDLGLTLLSVSPEESGLNHQGERFPGR